MLHCSGGDTRRIITWMLTRRWRDREADKDEDNEEAEASVGPSVNIINGAAQLWIRLARLFNSRIKSSFSAAAWQRLTAMSFIQSQAGWHWSRTCQSVTKRDGIISSFTRQLINLRTTGFSVLSPLFVFRLADYRWLYNKINLNNIWICRSWRIHEVKNWNLIRSERLQCRTIQLPKTGVTPKTTKDPRF